MESSWQGWGNITNSDKDDLKHALNLYMSYIKNYYTADLNKSKIIRIQRLIGAIDLTDPTEAAKILNRFSMEERSSLDDYIWAKFRDANKAYAFLYDLSIKYTEPLKVSKADIFLKNIAKYNNKNTGNVEIFGLQDYQPEISFGVGRYKFDEDFIKSTKNTNEFYIDIGQNWKIINFQEVLKKIHDAIQTYYNDNSNV